MLVVPRGIHGNRRRHWIRRQRGRANHARRMMQRRDALMRRQEGGHQLTIAEIQEWRHLNAALSASVHGLAYRQPRAYDAELEQREIEMTRQILAELAEEESGSS